MYRPILQQAGGVAVAASATYDGVWQQCIIAYKERHAWSLSRPLGDALAWAIAGLLREDVPIALVPVPSDAARVRQRGEDVTGRLAARAAKRLRQAGVDARVERVLRHGRSVADQSGLDELSRARNLAGSMEARYVCERACVVVDDIMTTGATLAESLRALSCTDVLGAAVVAFTPRKFHSKFLA